MKVIYDEVKLEESIKKGAYDEKNRALCSCGKHLYPSKLMLIRFLEQFPELPGEADVWSMRNWDDGTVEIHVDIKYSVSDVDETFKESKDASANTR